MLLYSYNFKLFKKEMLFLLYESTKNKEWYFQMHKQKHLF